MEITFFYIPVGTSAEALTIGNLAVEHHLAACANVFPIQSVFPWNGLVEREEEFVLILKTMPTHASRLRSFLEERHSYAIPCILSWGAEVNIAYGDWVSEQVMNIEHE